VRAFYRGWSLNPYFDAGKFGGVYALAAPVAARVFPLPEVTADDEYVARACAGLRHAYRPDATFTVTAPATLRDLLRIRRRSRRGTAALAAAAPRSSAAGFARACTRAALRPARWPDIAVYAAVIACVRLGLWLDAPASDAAWERDDSSRRVAPGG
jgi:hypothetical protein